MTPPDQAAPEADQMVNTLKQRLQSTVMGDKAGVSWSPQGSPVLPEGRGRVLGKCTVKLQFPSFGKMEDEPDPLLYLEKCNDYLALNPLCDEE